MLFWNNRESLLYTKWIYRFWKHTGIDKVYHSLWMLRIDRISYHMVKISKILLIITCSFYFHFLHCYYHQNNHQFHRLIIKTRIINLILSETTTKDVASNYCILCTSLIYFFEIKVIVGKLKAYQNTFVLEYPL